MCEAGPHCALRAGQLNPCARGDTGAHPEGRLGEGEGECGREGEGFGHVPGETTQEHTLCALSIPGGEGARREGGSNIARAHPAVCIHVAPSPAVRAVVEVHQKLPRLQQRLPGSQVRVVRVGAGGHKHEAAGHTWGGGVKCG